MSKLLKKTIRLTKQTKVPTLKIVEGTGLTEAWVRKFQRGGFDDPGVSKVEVLHDFLQKNVSYGVIKR